jgi:hypothetical protein
MGRFRAPAWNAAPQLLLDGVALCVGDIQGLFAVLFVYCTVRASGWIFLCIQYLFVRNITVTIAASTIPPHVCPTPTKRCSVCLHMMRNECVGGATACSRREVMRATLFPCRFAPFWFRPRCILSAGIFAVGVLALPVSHIVTLDSTLP